jgi:ketosteroid isomerase-like protein
MPERADLVKQLFDLMARGAVDEIVAHYHEDATVEILAEQRVVRGRQELVAYLREEAASTRVAETTSLHFDEHGDAVVVTGRIRLRDVDGAMSDSPGAWIFEFEGDRVVRVRGFRDHDAAWDALERDER